MTSPGRDPYWYKDAIIYEVNLRAFCDSDADGVGDLPGLTSKLDYLRDLGVTALWLLPFYPSPLRDDGYDISDYKSVAPVYGTLEDFSRFLSEAHERGLRVITELVLNHTSDRHPWFQRARRAPPGSPERDFYVWSDTPQKYKDARIIFKDFEHSNWTWDPAAKAFYWHRFYFHQPDLNFDNPEVRKAMLEVVDFWLGLGSDGLRLDAVPYLFEREGTDCENLPETHAFLRELRAHVEGKFKDRMLLGEANQWPEDAAAYFGKGAGDECHTAFHFPLMPRMFMALQTEDRFPIVDILEQTPALPESGQWALFLRNHDELTLEMVTDEERDYMYRVYAHDPQARINLGIRRRLAPLLSNHRRRIELLNGLLFSLPGTPVLYYGDEIGMGDNFYLGDRNGVRTPMQWSSDRNAGFSRANAQKLYLPVVIDPEYHYEAINVDVQQNNNQSLLWWMKRFIAVRKRSRAFGRGALKLLSPDNRKVVAFVRSHLDEVILVVANLSRFVQHVELGLPEYAGRAPVEILGRSEFPVISEAPYPVTLGPHDFYWFLLRAPQAAPIGVAALAGPATVLAASWRELFGGPETARGEELLGDYVRACERLAGRPVPGAAIAPCEFQEVTPFSLAAFVPLDTGPGAGEPQPYVVRLAYAAGDRAVELRRLHPEGVIAVVDGAEAGLLYDAALDKEFCLTLLRSAQAAPALAPLLQTSEPLEPAPTWSRDGSVIISYSGRCSLRLSWRLEGPMSPDWELSRFLTERARFQGVAAYLGVVQRRRRDRTVCTLAVIHAHYPLEGYAWQHVLDSLGRYFEKALSGAFGRPEPPEAPLLDLATQEFPPQAYERLGPFLQDALLLGRRTAELHLALASEQEDPAFVPEPFSGHSQRSLYQSMRTATREAAARLRKNLAALPEPVRSEAQRVAGLEEAVLRAFRALYARRLTGLRIRCHGNFHLGRVIYTGKDFLITGFEGEPGASLSERRLKRSPLRDVASMLRSFHYAVHTALFGRATGSSVRPEDRAPLEAWAASWQTWACAAFLKGYLNAAAGAPFMPESRAELSLLLDAYLREKAVRELGYELLARPDRAAVPLKGLARLLENVSFP